MYLMFGKNQLVQLETADDQFVFLENINSRFKSSPYLSYFESPFETLGLSQRNKLVHLIEFALQISDERKIRYGVINEVGSSFEIDRRTTRRILERFR